MRFLALLLLLPFICFAETLNVALYENHDNYIEHSRAYKVNWELLKLLAEDEGLILRTKPYLWVRALDALKNNRVDAVIGAYYSEERNEIGHFSPPFALDGIFLYAKKQNSLSEVVNYKKNKPNQKLIDEISSLALPIAKAATLEEFERLIQIHESFVSKLIGQQPIQQLLFSDFTGIIKSLGAWGGDFILVTGTDNVVGYFKSKGYSTIIPFSKMI